MYNQEEVQKLIKFIKGNDGIGDKEKLSVLVQKKFNLTKDRKVFSNEFFAIRFSKSEKVKMSNTILSLSALQKYDNRPFIVCIVSSETNYLVLANTTFLKKISHSSKDLRSDNIKGSFNGSDIISEFHGIENQPCNFKSLYEYHEGLPVKDNLERLVESTNGIVGRTQKFIVSEKNKHIITDSVLRAIKFVKSEYFSDLNNDLNDRVGKVQGEIAIAAFIDNVNIRGRIIEYLITDNGSTLKEQIIKSLHKKRTLPQFKTEDKLGDYSKNYNIFNTETDIKTKVLFLDGNPKAYNIDKLLSFLSTEKSVYMIYLLGIDDNKKIISRLVSVFDSRLVNNTQIRDHWAGRQTRGVAQFIGKGLNTILSEDNSSTISEKEANQFIEKLIEL